MTTLRGQGKGREGTQKDREGLGRGDTWGERKGQCPQDRLDLPTGVFGGSQEQWQLRHAGRKQIVEFRRESVVHRGTARGDISF